MDYAAPVPVSRKRKKSRKSRTSTPAGARRTWSTAPVSADRPELVSALARLAAGRRELEERRWFVATEAAAALVAGLAEWTTGRGEADLEDELCTRIGAQLVRWDDMPLEESVAPPRFAEAVLAAAEAAVRTAVAEPVAESDGWRARWRVLAAVARILPYPMSEAAAQAVDGLRDGSGGRVLPRAIDHPAVRGQVLWTRDAYGSRFAVTAAFSTPDGPDRWYLWDIDACGHQAFTVHSGYYPTRESALAAWQAGVGSLAAAETSFIPVDDWLLLVGLLPAEEGFLRSGGEDAGQFAEYHRSKRLAEVAAAAVGSDTRAGDRITRASVVATAADEFIGWLPDHRADLPDPAELAERVTELADSWFSTEEIVALYHTCSPHRVALTVLHLRNYYQDDFAASLIGLLPDWISWLARSNGTPNELVERCRPYALGEVHTDVGSDDSRPNYLARVIE